MADEQSAQVQVTTDYVERYANNVRFESTVWDLKVLFANYDQSAQQPIVHTAMHLGWPQVKLVAFYLYLNALFQEASSGHQPVPVPKGFIPKPLTIPEALKDDPKAHELFQRIEGLRRDLFGLKGPDETQEG